MIYTVTFNPSLDYILNIDKVDVGVVNRTNSEKIYVGGKGINVSIMLSNLNIESKSLGFISGFTGEEIKRILSEFNCQTDFINLNNGFSRINIKIKSSDETEINCQGPKIEKHHINQLFEKLEILKSNDILVLAGSIPSTLPSDIYEVIMKKIENKKIKVVVDATKDLLTNVLKYNPFLIKPNNHELGEIFNKKLQTNNEIIFYAKELQKQGAKNVLVSMASNGAILIDENGKEYFLNAPNGKLINSVGSGDSMVAGFLTGYLLYNDYEKAFKMGISSGSASAFSPWLAEKSFVEQIFNSL